MSSAYPPAVQRPALLKFAEASGSASTALRRDECGDPRINGKYGHIYAVPGTLDAPGLEGFQLCCRCESARARTYAKRVLSFARTT
jgi:hypothetical protein